MKRKKIKDSGEKQNVEQDKNCLLNRLVFDILKVA